MKKYVFITALVLFLGMNLPFVQVLSISNRKSKNFSERVYSRSALASGFAISYTHSVNKGRVHDFYTVLSDGQLELYMTEFVSYGAGIPEPGETEGAEFHSVDDGYVIDGLHRRLQRLVMAVGLVAEHSFTITDSRNPLATDFSGELFLKSFFKPQTSLLFEVKRVSILNYLMERKI